MALPVSIDLEGYSLTTLLAAGGVVLGGVYLIANRISVSLARQRIKQQNGCEPLSSFIPMWDKLFGIDNMLANIKAYRDHKLLERAVNNFNNYGNTFGTHLFNQNIIVTIEPENEIFPGRRASRARVVAAGLTDDDIDRMIKQAQKDVEPLLG